MAASSSKMLACRSCIASSTLRTQPNRSPWLTDALQSRSLGRMSVVPPVPSDSLRGVVGAAALGGCQALIAAAAAVLARAIGGGTVGRRAADG